jgi:uncharacterized protein YpmB
MAKVPELKGGQMITIAYFIGILVILFIVYKILGSVGLIKTASAKKEEKAEEAAVDAVRTGDIFDPTYYFDKKYKSLGNQYITMYSNELRKAMTGLGTDEEAIFVVFGKLFNKCQVSELAAGYKYKFQRDLKTDLLNELNAADIATIMSIVNKLPNN